jgi:hypothetical protein
MMRSSVVLPQPEGPSSATSSPVGKSSDTSSSAATKLPKRLWMLRTWMLMAVLREGSVIVQLRGAVLDPGLDAQGDQRQQRQQRGHREGGGELVFVVEDLDVQRQRVGLAADVARTPPTPRRTRPSRGRCRGSRRTAGPT